MRKLILALCLLFPLLASSAEPQRVNFNEYKAEIDRLASECMSKSIPHFNGFCLSQKYDDQTKTSITVALQVISFEHFYKKCEHSDFPNRNDILVRALNIEEAKRFFEEMRPQKKALETYSSYFDYCKTNGDNDIAVSKKLKWFEYMIEKYSSDVRGKDSGGNRPTLQKSETPQIKSSTFNRFTEELSPLLEKDSATVMARGMAIDFAKTLCARVGGDVAQTVVKEATAWRSRNDGYIKAAAQVFDEIGNRHISEGGEAEKQSYLQIVVVQTGKATSESVLRRFGGANLDNAIVPTPEQCMSEASSLQSGRREFRNAPEIIRALAPYMERKGLPGR